MKKLLTVLLLTAILSGSAIAQAPPISYFGLYCDEHHSSRCAAGTGSYEVTMWIWCLPGVDGLYGVEFAVVYPAGLIPGEVERNPIFPVQIGDLSSVNGVATPASECLKDWTWVFRQTLHVVTSDAMEVRLKGSTMGGIVYEVPIHTTCGYTRPICDFRVLNHFYINYSDGELECQTLGTESRSWGAIKSLFR